MAPKLTLLVLLLAVICLSQLYRASNSVIALPTRFMIGRLLLKHICARHIGRPTGAHP